MIITSTLEKVSSIEADALVIGVWKDAELEGHAHEVDRDTGGLLTRLLASEDISAGVCKVTALPGIEAIVAGLLVVVGLGDRNDAPSGLAFRAAGAAARYLAKKTRRRIVYALELDPAADAVCGSMTGCRGQDLYQSEKSLHEPNEIVWSHTSNDDLDRGRILAEAIHLTRTLVNEPANEVYPETFAAACQRAGQDSGFEVEVWDEQRLEQEKCGALLAVSRASDRPPRLAIMRYSGSNDGPLLALVGKGVTFDSGGLSIKPTSGMLTMKRDMAGAATVLGAMQAVAQLGLPVNLIGVVGLVENMINGRAYKLGDVLQSRNGTTIEVHNTDAEGRLVLADALNVAVTCGAARIIDLATLTGACVVALGNDVGGLMSNDDEFCEQVRAASMECGEAAWPLPMFSEYDELIKSKVADIKNVGDGRAGGAITAAKLLQQFVNELPWVHVDIAGPSFVEKPVAWIDAGATGYFVRTLVNLIDQMSSP
ncbi:MAG: leucyl aminopeptidase [Pirellulaceae bacterium]